jgi:hypothetical protein
LFAYLSHARALADGLDLALSEVTGIHTDTHTFTHTHTHTHAHTQTYTHTNIHTHTHTHTHELDLALSEVASTNSVKYSP